MAAVEAPIAIVCASCGDHVELSARRAREHRGGYVCRMCRRVDKPLSDAERAKLQAWWLDRMPLDELQDIARMIWPDAG